MMYEFACADTEIDSAQCAASQNDIDPSYPYTALRDFLSERVDGNAGVVSGLW
jgi:hypothetical protein